MPVVNGNDSVHGGGDDARQTALALAQRGLSLLAVGNVAINFKNRRGLPELVPL